MFVSSYNTYINTNNINKVQKESAYNSKESTDFRSSLLETEPEQSSFVRSSLPINYIRSPQSFFNKFETQRQQEKLVDQNNAQADKTKKATTNFTKFSTLQVAKQAYKDNSIMFSLIQKPSVTLDQTPKYDKKNSSSLQELKAKAMKEVMVDTYISNENYYLLTA